MRPPKRRQKPGDGPSAAYRRWEKGAIDGVSLVADAAEHLERAEAGKEAELDQNALGQKNSESVVKAVPHFPNCSRNPLVESMSQTTSKLKLQLFPIDDRTRRALEMDKHNPHLELTLSTRKKISSVVEHLSRKWGNSAVACGELMLFPYGVQRESLLGYERWTQNSVVTAADVYELTGRPPFFRLRYGWFSNDEFVSREPEGVTISSSMQLAHNEDMENTKGSNMDSVPISVASINERSENFVDHSKDQINPINQSQSPAPSSINMLSETQRPGYDVPNNESFVQCGVDASSSRNQKETGDHIMIRPFENAEDLRLSNGTTLFSGEWTDNTNFSVGELLAEVPQDSVDGCLNLSVLGNSQCFDSFDAAIAARKSRQIDKVGLQSCVPTHSASILDGEETCDAFCFRKNSVICGEELGTFGNAASEARQSVTGTSLVSFNGLNEKQNDGRGSMEDPVNADPMDLCPSDAQIMESPPKDFNSLTDIYWPDSLAPLELDMPSSRYVGQYLILSDSLGGFNRMIANSLDAFQNCLLYGLDKKEPASGTESQRSACFSDLKVSAKV